MIGNVGPFISVYLAHTVALLAFSVFVLMHFSPDIATNLEHKFFRIFVLSFQGYTVFDSLQTLRQFDLIYISKDVYTAICFLTFVFIVLCTACFCMIISLHIRKGQLPSKPILVLSLVPLVLTVISLFISLFNGMVFSISEDVKIIRGPAYILTYIFAFFYLAAIFRAAAVRVKKAETAHSRREFLSLVFFVLLIAAWAILDTKLKDITSLPVLIFAVIFYLFVSFQQSNIYTDTLTGMNNRRKAENYLSGELKNISEDMPIYMFMGDINGFKGINDQYGHHEGDTALIIFAEAVKKSANAYKGFAARYGGDEFVWAWRPIKGGDMDPEMVIEDIRHRVKAECIAMNKPYIISLSIGYIICTDPSRSTISYLNEADRKMYADKEGHYRKNGR